MDATFPTGNTFGDALGRQSAEFSRSMEAIGGQPRTAGLETGRPSLFSGEAEGAAFKNLAHGLGKLFKNKLFVGGITAAIVVAAGATLAPMIAPIIAPLFPVLANAISAVASGGSEAVSAVVQGAAETVGGATESLRQVIPADITSLAGQFAESAGGAVQEIAGQVAQAAGNAQLDNLFANSVGGQIGTGLRFG